eukprot:3940095-Rhodomonas_salina.2
MDDQKLKAASSWQSWTSVAGFLLVSKPVMRRSHTKGWSLRHAFLSSASRVRAIPTMMCMESVQKGEVTAGFKEGRQMARTSCGKLWESGLGAFVQQPEAQAVVISARPPSPPRARLEFFSFRIWGHRRSFRLTGGYCRIVFVPVPGSSSAFGKPAASYSVSLPLVR